MSEIRTALTRKFGPLPAWAWGAILLVFVLAYRKLSGQYNAPSAATTDPGSDATVQEPQEPTTLQPGESVYDPNTGQLISTAPEQQPTDPADPTTRPKPVVLRPGQGVYDPATGKLVTLPHVKPGKGKRKPKPKPHHRKPRKPKHPHHGEHKPKPHGHGNVKHPRPRKTHTAATVKPKARARQRFTPDASGKPQKARMRSMGPRTGAMRQRPAASHPKARNDSHIHPKATRRRHR